MKLLFEQARTGDLKAYEQIVIRFQDMACTYAFSILGDFHLAQDIAQEAFVEAYKKLDQLRIAEAFPGWFRRIVFTHCNRMTRIRRVQSVSLETVGDITSTAHSPSHAAAFNDMQEHALNALLALPQYQRTVTTLFYIEGYSQQEIAEFLDIPVTTIKKRLHDARKHLKERIHNMKKTLKNNLPNKHFSEKIMVRVLTANLLPQSFYRAKRNAVTKVLGLDIGHYAIKAIELTLERHRLVVTAAAWERLSSPDDTADASRRLITKNRLNTDYVVTSIDSSQVWVRFTTINKLPTQELEKAMRLDLETALPCPPEEVEYYQQILGDLKKNKSVNMMAIAAKRNVINDYLMLIQNSGLRPAIIDPDSMALGNAIGLGESNATTHHLERMAVVAIGAKKTIICIGSGTDSFFTRILPLGVVEPQKVDGTFIKNVALEIQRTFNYYQKTFCQKLKNRTVDRVMVAGGAVHLDGLVEQLAQNLGVGVIRFDPFECLDIKLPDPEILRRRAPDLVVALGLASRIRTLAG